MHRIDRVARIHHQIIGSMFRLCRLRELGGEGDGDDGGGGGAGGSAGGLDGDADLVTRADA